MNRGITTRRASPAVVEVYIDGREIGTITGTKSLAAKLRGGNLVSVKSEQEGIEQIVEQHIDRLDAERERAIKVLAAYRASATSVVASTLLSAGIVFVGTWVLGQILKLILLS